MIPMAHFDRTRTGFIMTELIVVLAITAILLSVTTVAVQAARERSRQMLCSNRVRQMTLAALEYENDHRGLPPATINRTPTFRRSDVSGMHHLLPYLGHDALSKKVRSMSPVTDSTFLASDPVVTVVNDLLCPSDSSDFGLDYRFCAGSTPFLYPYSSLGREHNGAFGFFETPLSSVTHGLSHTAAFSERVKSKHDGVFDWDSDYWKTSFFSMRGDLLTPEYFAALAEQLLIAPPPPNQVSFLGGRYWHTHGRRSVLYDHVMPPNDRCRGIVGGRVDVLWADNRGVSPASSHHPAGVVMSLLDGSVKVVSRSVDPQVWSDYGSAKD